MPLGRFRGGTCFALRGKIGEAIAEVVRSRTDSTDRLESGCAVPLEDMDDTAFPDDIWISGLLCILLPLLGMDFDNIRLIGRTSWRSSSHGATLLERSTARSSTALPLPFLLSLRLSRIPIALRFLTAGDRNSPPAEESLRGWAEPAALIGSSDPECEILPVSICNCPCERSREARSSVVPSLQSAGVGGIVSRLVPVPGGRLDRNGNGAIPEDGLSTGRFRLCERTDGGGPGGGGGRGMLGSQETGLGE